MADHVRISEDLAPFSEAACATEASGPQEEVSLQETSFEVPLLVTSMRQDELLEGIVLERGEARIYRRKSRSLRGRWGAKTRVVMGRREDVRPEAPIYVKGWIDPSEPDVVNAVHVAALTGVVQVEEG